MSENVQEEGLDIVALLKTLWKGRKIIIICTGVFLALGLIAALSMKRTYKVESTMVPQLGSSRSYSMGSLASLAGLDLGFANASAKDLSPLVYPQIVTSVPFKLALMHTPLHYAESDTTLTMLDYARDYSKTTALGTIRKYTIGLPGVIMGAFKKESADSVVTVTGEDGEGPYQLTTEEAGMLGSVGVQLLVDRKEGYLTLVVNGSEPLQTAELALAAQHQLQEELTRFRTEKAEKELEYIKARYYEIKAETEAYQAALATVIDRSQNMATTRSRLEEERIRSKYNVSNAIYMEMAKQLEQAKMQVKHDTPVLAIVQPVTVPLRPSNSRASTLIIWVFLGFVLGCGIVLGIENWPKIKEKFSEK